MPLAGLAQAEDPVGEEANQIADTVNEVAPPVEGTARMAVEENGGALTAASETLEPPFLQTAPATSTWTPPTPLTTRP
jgi:hypothetical protein